MTRDIKFRGRRLDDMNWMTGSLVILNGRYFIFNDEGRDEVGKASVGQYTGLKDKNGTEIFEGDILRVPDTFCLGGNGYVRITHDGMIVQCGDGPELEWMLMWVVEKGDGIILGNIHDNPELLKRCPN